MGEIRKIILSRFLTVRTSITQDILPGLVFKSWLIFHSNLIRVSGKMNMRNLDHRLFIARANAIYHGIIWEFRVNVICADDWIFDTLCLVCLYNLYMSDQ